MARVPPPLFPSLPSFMCSYLELHERAALQFGPPRFRGYPVYRVVFPHHCIAPRPSGRDAIARMGDWRVFLLPSRAAGTTAAASPAHHPGRPKPSALFLALPCSCRAFPEGSVLWWDNEEEEEGM